MNAQEEIGKAIAAHGQWKQTLRTAIDTGKCESTPAKVKMACNCSFGKWLNDRVDPQVKDTRFYHEVVDIHAQFHKEAGSILELALSGNIEEAHDLMKLGSNFSKLSSLLTIKMKDWQTHLLAT